MVIKTKKILFLLFLVVLFIGITCVSYAATRWYSYHVLHYWCVDSGKHLDWSGSSSYLSNWNTGVNTWNAYKSGVIRQDSALTVNDVTIRDVSDLTGDAVAITDSKFPEGGGKGSAVISFATAKMNTLSQIKRNITCTHEIGHALGLDDNNSNGTSVIMYNNMSNQTSNNVLHSEDKFNYDYMYNNKY